MSYSADYCVLMDASSSSFPFVVSSHSLTTDDLTQVFNTVEALQSRWKILGGYLGIKAFRIDAIEVEERKCESQLREVLSCWLKGQGIPRSPSVDHDTAVSSVPPSLSPQLHRPSWRSLSEAVKEMDEKETTIKIIRDHECNCEECLEAAGTRNTKVGREVGMGNTVEAACALYEDFEELLTHAGKEISPKAIKDCIIAHLKPGDHNKHVMDHLTKLQSFQLSRKILKYLNENNFLNCINCGMLKKIWSIDCSQTLPKFDEYYMDYSCFLQSHLNSFPRVFNIPDLELHPPKGLPILTIHLASVRWSEKSLFELQTVIKKRTTVSPDQINLAKVSKSPQNCFDVIYAVWPSTVSTVVNEFTLVTDALKDDGVLFDFSDELVAFHKSATESSSVVSLPSGETMIKQSPPTVAFDPKHNGKRSPTTSVSDSFETSMLPFTAPKIPKICYATLAWAPPSCNGPRAQYKLSYKKAGDKQWKEYNVGNTSTPCIIDTSFSENACHLFKWEESTTTRSRMKSLPVSFSNTSNRRSMDCESPRPFEGTLSVGLNKRASDVISSSTNLTSSRKASQYFFEFGEFARKGDSLSINRIPTQLKVKQGSIYEIRILPVFIDGKESLPIDSSFIQIDPSVFHQPPGKPKVQVKSSSEIYIEWENKPSNCLKKIDGYKISCYKAPSHEYVSSVFSSCSNHTFEFLIAEATYFFGVKAMFSDGTKSQEVYSDSIQTLAPSLNFSCQFEVKETYHDCILLHWEVPQKDVADKIEYYSIQYKYNNSSNQWNHIPERISTNNYYLVKNLDQNTSYIFQLYAHYSNVRLGPAELFNISTKKTQQSGPPGKPEFKMLESDEIEIRWQKPSINDEHVQAYELYSRPCNGKHTLMRECEENIVKIESYQFDAKEKYIFEVRAVCSNGNFSEFSECSEELFVKRCPRIDGKPKAVNCTSNSIQLQWNPANHFQVLTYKVSYAESNIGNWQFIETSSEMANIENLKPDTRYVFKVKAKSESHSNAYGPDSDLSDPVKTTLPPPTEVRCIITPRKPIKLAWNAPENAASSSNPPVSFYDIYYNSENSTEWRRLYSKLSNLTVETELSELEFGLYYRFKVYAFYNKGINQTAERSESEPTSKWCKIPYPVPSQPESLTIAKVDQDSVLLKWNKPAINGEHVKSYSVYKRTACTEDRQSDFERYTSKEITQEELESEVHVTGLNPSTTYQFQVEALNTEGVAGSKSETKLIKTHRKAPTPPGKPYMLRVTHNMVKINWEKPEKNSEMVSQYEVYYKKCQKTEDVDWMVEQTLSNSTEIEICNLDHSSEYIFKVRLITENIDDCTYSEESEPVKMKSALPSEPGKPKGETNLEGSISLTWARPEENFKDISHYEVEYHQEGDESKTQIVTTDGAEEQKRITGLCHKKGYYFSVRAVTKTTGESSRPSLKSDLITSDKTLAARFLPISTAISVENDGKIPFYLLPGEEVYSNDSLKKMEIKLKSDSSSPYPERKSAGNKVLMLVGATGAGKSTLINAMINYIMRVEYGNPFRLKLIHDTDVSQTKSVTKLVSAYTLHYESGFAIPYTLTIIDTPGFGDTAGIERDKEITQQIKKFFSIEEGITHLDGVGFVCQSCAMRLTYTQRYIFDSILAIFGNDVRDNIFVLCTFCDGEPPQVIKAVEEVNIPADKHYEFNNSALYSSSASNRVAQSFWEMGVESFIKFFQQLEAAKQVSIRLTKDVLQQREDLEACAIELKQQIQQTMVMIDDLKNDVKILNQLQAQNKDGDGEIEVKVDVTERVELKKQRANICLKCNMTCHYPCQYSINNHFRKDCVAMEKKNGKMYCKECPGCCFWDDHKIVTYKLEKSQKTVKTALKDITEKYPNAMNTTQEAIECLKNKIDLKFEEVFELVKRAKDCRKELDKIALLPNHLNDTEYIEMLIEAQNQEKREGYTKRIEQYKVLKERAEILTQTGEFSAKRNEVGTRWWEERFLNSE